MSPMREVDELKALRLRLCEKVCARDPAEAICRDPVKCPNIVRGAPADTASHMPPSQSSTAVTGTSSTFAERALSLNTLFYLPLLVLLLKVFYVLAGRIEKRQPGAQVKDDKAEEEGSVPAPEAEAPDTAENDKPAAKDMASDVERSAAAEAAASDEREAANERDVVDEIEREIGEEHAAPASDQPAEDPASDVERSAAAEAVVSDEREAANEVDVVDEIEREIGEEHAAPASDQPAEDPASDVEGSAAADAVANDEREAANELDVVDEIEREIGEEGRRHMIKGPAAARLLAGMAVEYTEDANETDAADANDAAEVRSETETVGESEREAGENETIAAEEAPAADETRGASSEEKVDPTNDVPRKSLDDTLMDKEREIMANALRSISPADAVAAAAEDVSSTATAS